jgi:hypothetical protein
MAASLAEIFNDPNYTNANAATKQAIFDKFSAQDPNYTNANAATQQAIRVKFGVAELAAPDAMPAERSYLGQMGRNVAGGVVEGLGNIGSTVLRVAGEAERLGGTLLGLPPFLSELGVADRTPEESARRRALIEQFATERLGAEPSAIGRTVGKIGTEIAGTAGVGPLLSLGTPARFPNVARALETGGFGGGQGAGAIIPRVLGGATVGGASAAVVNPADLTTGMAFGAGAPFVMGLATKLIGKGIGAAADATTGGGIAESRARNMLVQSIGEQNMPNAMAALRIARPEGIPDEALVGVSRPAFISLVDLAAKRDPDSTINALRDLQQEDMFNELARIAGGFTQTEAKATREATKLNLRGMTAPMRKEALASAGLAGRYAPGLETDVSRFQGAAAGKVEDVRRFEGARVAAEAKAGQAYPIGGAGLGPAELTGMPRIPGRYSYPDELAKRADQMMDEAAEGSMRLGDAARFAQYQLDSLAAEGLTPLRTDAVVGQIQALGAKPETAGNREFKIALNRVVNDIREWTDSGGVIAPEALEAIRKNSVASTIRTLYKDPDAPAARTVAAGILSDIKPIIDDAIEAAGGTGWRDYMRAFESGMAEVNQQKVAAQALDLFPKDRAKSGEEYVRLVRGDRPEDIEKVFGRGKYDIVKEMGARYPTLDKLASAIEQQGAIKTAVQRGSVPLENILKENRGLFKLPSFFDPKVTAGNRLLDILADKVDTKTMDVVMNAVRTNADLLKVLENVPPSQRNRVIRALSNDKSWMPAATAPVTAGGAIMAGED